MLQDERGHTQQVSNAQLGENFEAQSSPSYGGELGASFEEHNSSREEWEKEKHRGRRMGIWIGVLTLALIVAAVVYFHTRPATGTVAPGAAAKGSGGGGRRGSTGPAAITVGESTTGNMNIYIDSLGTVTPLNTVTLYSQITGRIMEVHYREGQLVHKGQPLIDIDPRPYQATLTEAQGTLKRDQGILDEAQMDLKRYQDAFARNAIARQQLEDQEKVVTQDEGTVVTDQGTVSYDETQLSYTHIVAPITGVVGLRLVDPGNTVFSGTGSTLVVITEVQPITVVFNVSEDDLPQVQAQLRTRKSLSVDAYDRNDEKMLDSGKMSSFDNQIDTTTGTLKFRASYSNSKLALFPNQFVNTHLLLDTLQNATLVPSGAVQHNGTQAFVYIVKPDPKNAKGNIVTVQAVTVLSSDENQTAVSGLNPATKLATSGFDRLESGVHVLIQGNGGTAGSSDSSSGQSSGAHQHKSHGGGSPTSNGTAPSGGNPAP